jgi:citrate lyase subunit beta/citryl-CoA lyase
MTTTRVPRSYLFVPASRPERIGKAIAAGADAVIVDLEDAVAPDAKAAARGLAEPWRDLQAQADAAGVALLLRINGADTSYFAEDVSFCRAGGVRRSCCPRPTRRRWLRCAPNCPRRRAAPAGERGRVCRSAHVARAPGVSRLLFGSIDLMFDLDVVTTTRRSTISAANWSCIPGRPDCRRRSTVSARPSAMPTRWPPTPRGHGVSGWGPSC